MACFKTGRRAADRAGAWQPCSRVARQNRRDALCLCISVFRAGNPKTGKADNGSAVESAEQFHARHHLDGGVHRRFRGDARACSLHHPGNPCLRSGVLPQSVRHCRPDAAVPAVRSGAVANKTAGHAEFPRRNQHVRDVRLFLRPLGLPARRCLGAGLQRADLRHRHGDLHPGRGGADAPLGRHHGRFSGRPW